MVDLAQNLLDINIQTANRPDLTSLTNARRSKNVGKDVLRDTAEQFEGFFLQMALESMTKGIGSEGDSLGNGGHAEQLWRSRMNEEFAKAIAQSGGIGIADSVYKELLALQEEKIDDPIESEQQTSSDGN